VQVDHLLLRLGLLVPEDEPQQAEQVLRLQVELHLLLLRVAAVEPHVVDDSRGVVDRLEDLVAVFVVAVEKVQRPEGLLVTHRLVPAEGQRHVPAALPVDQLAGVPQKGFGLGKLDGQQFGFFLEGRPVGDGDLGVESQNAEAVLGVDEDAYLVRLHEVGEEDAGDLLVVEEHLVESLEDPLEESEVADRQRYFYLHPFYTAIRL
jgi:hypothetical protein